MKTHSFIKRLSARSFMKDSHVDTLKGFESTYEKLQNLRPKFAGKHRTLGTFPGFELEMAAIQSIRTVKFTL